MSKKSTKIIAAAGVVAGLGVAALPAMTFAAAEVAGQVQLDVEVQPAIAMTIEGNNDATLGGVDTYSPDTAGVYIGSYSTDGKTPYDSTNLQTSGSSTSLLPNAKVDGAWGQGENNFGSLITVYTNASGYTLTVQDADDDNALEDGAKTIPAGTTISAGTSAWAFKGGSISSYTAVPVDDGETNPVTVKTGSGATLLTGDATTVLYGVSTSANQATGNYTDTIVYTATTN